MYTFCVQCQGQRSLCGEFCEQCCFQARWARISRKGQREKKVFRQSPNTVLLTVRLLQLGPSTDPYMHTPWPPHYHTHLRGRLDKPEKVGSEALMSQVWPLPLSLSGLPVHLNINEFQDVEERQTLTAVSSWGGLILLHWLFVVRHFQFYNFSSFKSL